MLTCTQEQVQPPPGPVLRYVPVPGLSQPLISTPPGAPNSVQEYFKNSDFIRSYKPVHPLAVARYQPHGAPSATMLETHRSLCDRSSESTLSRSPPWWNAPEGVTLTTNRHLVSRHTQRDGADVCAQAAVDAFWEVRFRARLSLDAWDFLQQIEPELRPWDGAQSIFDTNADLLVKEHPIMTSCIPYAAEESFGNEDAVAVSRSLSNKLRPLVWCRLHQQLERLTCRR